MLLKLSRRLSKSYRRPFLRSLCALRPSASSAVNVLAWTSSRGGHILTPSSLTYSWCSHGVLPRDREDQVRRSRFDQRSQLSPLQRRREGRRQDDEGAPPLRRLLLAHLPRHG